MWLAAAIDARLALLPNLLPKAGRRGDSRGRRAAGFQLLTDFYLRLRGFDKIAGAILDDANASVRSEAEDERPSPAASNPTLSATRDINSARPGSVDRNGSLRSRGHQAYARNFRRDAETIRWPPVAGATAYVDPQVLQSMQAAGVGLEEMHE